MAAKKLREFTKAFSYAFMSNVLSSLIAVVITLVLPKLISMEQYGFYQLYVFFTSYVGVSYLGLCDGVYLRIGGQYYEQLDKPLYSTQFRLLGMFEAALYAVIFVLSLFFSTSPERHYVIDCVCVAAVGMCLRWFITFVLQATAWIKEYAIVTISERILYVLAAVPMVLAGYRGFRLLIVLDVAAKYISLGIGVWYCRDMIRAKTLPLRGVIPEIKENISVGFKFMLAQLSDMLIIGVVRFGVQSCWDIATFSRISMTLTVSNLVMTAINAISIVMYPLLRRMDEGQLPGLYKLMRVSLVGFAFAVLLFYYPLQRILSVWLPQYAVSFRYAAILFPVCVYQSKMSMLINTYYKALRLEKQLMRCNIAALVLSGVLTVLSTVVLHNVTAAIISILICLVFRGIIGELILSKHIAIEVKKDIVIELCMTVAFILCNWFFGFAGMLMYAGCYVLYLFIKKNDIKETVSFVKSMR
ncbi:lipopolysaccharide biosynthesis protein [uncultured Dysosmobacter sp.]|uniref:lipopolysaccharide biosynthesis protein n=1 Tax=uncultured Dysosmobacter sp. TaxID=2591384 RepID=UPI00263305AA|nr:hypothetical protein [uncultured Dysosmobacter sp.]